MTEADVAELSSRMVWVIIKCSAPLLLVSLIVGLVISIFQTVTSIQEQTLTFVPKLLAIFIVLMLFWSSERGLTVRRNPYEFYSGES